MLKEKDRARVRPRIVEGEIVEVRFDQKTGEKSLLLVWAAEDGEHQRWFPAEELEPIDDA